MKCPVETAEIVAADLMGTCQSLAVVLERHDAEGMEENLTFCAVLDQNVMECTCCGWWFETSEAREADNGEMICEDCDK